MDKDQLNNQEDYNAELRVMEDLLRRVNILRRQLGQDPMLKEDAKNAQALRNEIRGLEAEMEALDNTSSSVYGQIKGIVAELQGVSEPIKNGRSAFRDLSNEARKLRDDEIGITDLTKAQVVSLQEKVGQQRKYLRDQADSIIKEDLLAENQKEQSQLANKTDKKSQERLKRLKKEEEEMKSILAAAEDESGVFDDLEKQITKRIELESKISQAVGVTGALVEGTGALMERLGMRSGIFHDAMKKAAQEMRDGAKAIEGQVTFMHKLDLAAKGFSIVAGGFSKALLDPASATLALVTGFLNVQKAAAKAAQLTGQFDMSMGAANSTLATTTDVLETAVELTQKLGMNAQNVISDATLAKAAELKNTMGLAADEAAGLAVMAQTSGQNLDAVTEAVVSTTSEFNKANRSAVSQGVVLRDVAKTSDSIKASLGNNPKALGQAAAAARRMGMELSRVDQIADSLMDFESSIEAELEAQLLTGKQINMAKARELALNNDLAGLSKELFKNSVDIAEFGKMNRIQQEAQAKALGMSKDELARIAYQRSLELGMTEEQAAAAAGVNAEDMKRMDIQEKIQKLVGKLQQAFAPILEVVVDIVDALAPAVQVIGGIIGGVIKFLNKLGVLKPLILGIAAVFALKSFAQPFGAAITGAQNLAKSLQGSFGGGSSIMKGVKKFGESIKSSFLAGKNGTKELSKQSQIYFDKNVQKFRDQTGKFVSNDAAKAAGVDKRFTKKPKVQESIQDKIKDDVKSKAPDTESITDATKTPEPAKGLGEKIKEFLTGLTDGLKYAGENAAQVALGGLALIPAALGLVAMTPAIPAMALMQLINGKKFSAALRGIGQGVAGLGKLLMGPQGLALLAGAGMIALLGASLIPLGIAVSYFSADSGLGLLMAGVGLAGLAVGIIGMAAALPFLIPASISLLAFGFVLKKIGPWLAEAAPGFAALADIGKGLVQAGMGLMALGGGIALLGAGAALLAVFGPIAAVGLTALAAGVLAAGILVIPAIPGLLALAGVMALLAPSLQKLGEVGPGLAAAGVGMLALGPALMALGVSALFAPLALVAGLAIAKMLKVLYPAIQPFFGMGKEMESIGKGMQGLGAGIALMGAGAALIGVFGPLFAFGLAAMGLGIAAFGAQLANPLFYAGIAALAIMSAGLAAAAGILNLAAPAFQALGESGAGMLKFAGAIAALGPAMLLLGAGMIGLPALYAMIPAMAMLSALDGSALILIGDGMKALAGGATALAGALVALGPAMLLFGATALFGLPALYMALPAFAAMALMGPGLEKSGNGLAKMAESLNKIANAAQNIDIGKLKEIRDTISDEAFNAAASTVSAVSDMVANVSAGGDDNAVLAEKLDTLINAVNNGHTLEIYLDSNKIEKYRTLDRTKGS